ncbi:MAG TPA: hypothetical protein VEJ63_06580, partial [Planctomycetota bacterium]|nr:hypothetical protein [Planctomycetota bacterium]
MLTAPAVRWLPAYATHLPFCNNRVDAFTDKSGQKCIFGLPYSSEALSHLYLINTETGESRKYRLPGDEHGAYCDVLGSDNRIYLGTLKGRLLAFDPVSTKFEELCFPFEGQYIWGGLATKAGKVFAGATPSGSFIVWDIASRKIEYTETRKFSGSVYANCFVELPDGRVLVGVGGAETHIGIYDPLKKTTSWHRPSWLEGITFVYGQRCFNGQIVLRTFPTKELLFIRPDDLSLIRRMEAQGDVCALPDGAGAERLYTSDGLSGKLYVLNGDRFEHVATPVPYEGGSLCALGPTTLATITNDATFFRYDVKTGHTFAKQLNSAESGGMACSALASDGKDRLFVTPFINQRLVEMDLRDGSSREVGRVAEHTGQVPVMGWHKGRLFLAYYTYAGICVYDPQKPYKFRENPKVLGLVGDEQYRPTGR